MSDDFRARNWAHVWVRHLRMSAARLLVVGVTLAACGGGGSDAVAPSTAAPAHAVLGGAVASTVEALPIPELAVLDPGSADEPSFATYLLPQGISVEALDDWYTEQLPDGEAFGTWSWCRTELIAEQIDRIYHHPGTNEILGLTLSQNDPEDGGQAFISLGRDESGPAHC